MVYVEFLRVRRTLKWHLGILAVATLLALYFGHNTTVNINGHSELFSGMSVPPGELSVIAAFFAMVFASIYASSLGSSLNRENPMRDISWTKPISRSRLALQYIVTDIAAIALVFALTMVAVFVGILRLQLVPDLETGSIPYIALGLGVAVMWYALIQLLTFWLPPSARSAGGILWPVAFVAIALTKVPGPLGEAARALDVINPIAYMDGMISDSSGARQASLWQLPVEDRALIVWLFAALFCAIVIALWPKKEA
jgi:hypothetical protein